MSTPSSTDELLIDIPQAEPGNFGIIPVSTMIMPHILTLDSYRVEHGRMIFNVSFEEIHEKLLLPEGYTITGVFFDAERALWFIMVRSEELPATLEGAMLPKVIPTYTKDVDSGIVTLTKLEAQTV